MNKQSASPLRRDEEKTRWRVGGGGKCLGSGSILLVDLMRQKGRKKKRRRNAVSLTAQCKQNSPRPPIGLKLQAPGSEKEMLSVCQKLLHYADVWEQEGTPQNATLQHFKSREIQLRRNKGRKFIHHTGNITKWGPFCGAAAALGGEVRGNEEGDAGWLTKARRL